MWYPRATEHLSDEQQTRVKISKRRRLFELFEKVVSFPIIKASHMILDYGVSRYRWIRHKSRSFIMNSDTCKKKGGAYQIYIASFLSTTAAAHGHLTFLD